jgi:hypothetical protein
MFSPEFQIKKIFLYSAIHKASDSDAEPASDAGMSGIDPLE